MPQPFIKSGRSPRPFTMRFVTIRAVIFDWGGTLTPWHTVDQEALWRSVCAQHFPERADALAAAIWAAERELWQATGGTRASATLDHIFDRAGLVPTEAFLASYFEAWEPHTFTDPDAPALLRGLRERGLRVGVLSNTMWPRSAHERVFTRDNVLGLIDGAVYSSEIAWVKPHPEAFRAAMAAVGVHDPAACVFVGDRPYDDVHGAKSVGMRAVLIANSDVPPFESAAPDAVILRLSELPHHLDTW
jgi:putative hydrolase of the HAD superfamily